ncbi:IS3 family transposase [Hymenobacter defluvii]|uniref:IS3 family transposase n=1 Tax=Hymenobacter defluvii TaxID=2054411 RepID=A0ABS3TKL3_9BACT|nr:IS3 family transposase [Hymenobacter defluvii]
MPRAIISGGAEQRPTPDWEPAATAAFSRHAQRYGTRRLRAELRAEGHAVGRYALRSWLRRSGLRALSTRPQRPRTTVADPAEVVAKNLLLGQPAPMAPNQVWVGDITYLPLAGGRWCYLATWRDTYSRRVVGWHLDQHMPTELVLTALEQALTLRQPAPGLIIHADCGSQYTSSACQTRIEKAHALASYSPMITPEPRPGGAHSKPNCCPAAAPLLAWKKPDWRSPTTSTPTSTSTAATPPSATARLTNSNTTSKSTYLSALSVFTGPPHYLAGTWFPIWSRFPTVNRN